MTLWALLLILAVIAFANKKPKRVNHYQPREVPIGRRRPSPWIAPPQVLQATVPGAPSMILPSVARAPQPPPISAHAVVLARIAAKAPTARAPVVVTVSTQIRFDALAALRRLGFSQKEAQAQLDTSLGLAIQQSLQGASGSVPAAATRPTDTNERRDDAYWKKLGTRVLQYLARRAGAQYTKELREGFTTWVGCAPGVLRQYEDGDDRKREAIVDQYLSLAHPDLPVKENARLVGRFHFVGSVSGACPKNGPAVQRKTRARLELTLANDSTITGSLNVDGVDPKEIIGVWEQDGRLSLRLPETVLSDGEHVRPTMIGNFDGQSFDGTLDSGSAKQVVSDLFRFSLTAK